MTTEIVKLYTKEDLELISDALFDLNPKDELQFVASLHYAIAILTNTSGMEEVDSIRLLVESYKDISEKGLLN